MFYNTYDLEYMTSVYNFHSILKINSSFYYQYNIYTSSRFNNRLNFLDKLDSIYTHIEHGNINIIKINTRVIETN